MSDLAGDVEREKETMTNQTIKKRISRAKASAAGRALASCRSADSDLRALVRIRQEAGISQSILAKRAGVCAVTLAAFEHGQSVRIHTAKVLRQAYLMLARAPELQSFGEAGILDASWLKRQAESFLRSNSIGVVEKDKLAHFVLSSERIYEFGRIVLLAAGKNIE